MENEAVVVQGRIQLCEQNSVSWHPNDDPAILSNCSAFTDHAQTPLEGDRPPSYLLTAVGIRCGGPAAVSPHILHLSLGHLHGAPASSCRLQRQSHELLLQHPVGGVGPWTTNWEIMQGLQSEAERGNSQRWFSFPKRTLCRTKQQ